MMTWFPLLVAINPSIRATGLSATTGAAAMARTGKARNIAVRTIARMKDPTPERLVWQQMRPFQGRNLRCGDSIRRQHDSYIQFGPAIVVLATASGRVWREHGISGSRLHISNSAHTGT